MPRSAARRVVLFGHNCDFFEFAAFHLAAAGLRTVAVVSQEELALALGNESPCAVLLHWDTLGDACLGACAAVKAHGATPVVVLSERLGCELNVVSTFASGADALVEGALNPRILINRLKWLSKPLEIIGY